MRCDAETEKTHTHQRSLVLDYLFVVFFILISEKSHIVWYMHSLHKFATERKICKWMHHQIKEWRFKNEKKKHNFLWWFFMIFVVFTMIHFSIAHKSAFERLSAHMCVFFCYSFEFSVQKYWLTNRSNVFVQSLNISIKW